MKVYYADDPFNHHFFVKTVTENHLDASLLRFDNHPDVTGNIPCSNYVSEIKNNFRNVVWFNKPKYKFYDDYFTVHTDRRAYAEMLSGWYSFETIDEVISHFSMVLMEKVVIDVDPDVILNYPCRFDTGELSIEELVKLINNVYSNYEVIYCFFASTIDFAEKIIKDSLVNDAEFEHLIDDNPTKTGGVIS